VRPGETLGSAAYRTAAGGKGFNQSLALARAGVAVSHVGCVGPKAGWLVKRLREAGIDTTGVRVAETPTGHAIIQVDPNGENAIVLYGGANQKLSPCDIAEAVATASAGDYLLLQNETSAAREAIVQAHEKGLKVVFNPAPMAPDIHSYPLDLVDLFVLNETEAQGITGRSEAQVVNDWMRDHFPASATVLTLGAKGAIYGDADTMTHEPGRRVIAADTTAAGDTFIGFFMAEWMVSGDPIAALRAGCCASSICVTRNGAADSIPLRAEVDALLTEEKKP